MNDTILLDPVLFDALHLSALKFGGIGQGAAYDEVLDPLCLVGHAYELGADVRTPFRTPARRNDGKLRAAGVRKDQRVPFKRWCEIVGVDVKD